MTRDVCVFMTRDVGVCKESGAYSIVGVCKESGALSDTASLSVSE